MVEKSNLCWPVSDEPTKNWTKHKKHCFFLLFIFFYITHFTTTLNCNFFMCGPFYKWFSDSENESFFFSPGSLSLTFFFLFTFLCVQFWGIGKTQKRVRKRVKWKKEKTGKCHSQISVIMTWRPGTDFIPMWITGNALLCLVDSVNALGR